MSREVLTRRGIFRTFAICSSHGVTYEWSRRPTFAVEKQETTRRIDQEQEAVNPDAAVAVCAGLGSK
ncbi:MAG TPA: hypothetical protein VL523_02860 [Terriglobia bacterium]|nr:hypothetical protein [Terriglobia bacterium]